MSKTAYSQAGGLTMPVRNLSFDEVIDRLLSLRQPYFSDYLAMYSSWYDGIITDPALMMVPVDDHLLNRGDGIFEVFKCVDWNMYALDRHLQRMKGGLETLGLKIPVDRDLLIEILRRTILAGNSGTCLTRIYVSRGPGGFSANPYESVANQLYVVAHALKPTAPERYEKGVTLITSNVPIKPGFFANIKNCNYLPNVLMKKQAQDAGADYSVSIDEKGFLAEGPTENIGLVTKKGDFLVPNFSRILRGITVSRVLELAQSLVGSKLAGVFEADITPEQAYDAAEMMVFGTSFDILPAIEYDGHAIGAGRPGPVFKKLLGLIHEDQLNNKDMLTQVKPA
jgi:branched-subunit amino acid aminotransferase/4-amino-4-deoxychorismate lyase